MRNIDSILFGFGYRVPALSLSGKTDPREQALLVYIQYNMCYVGCQYLFICIQV